MRRHPVISGAQITDAAIIDGATIGAAIIGAGPAGTAAAITLCRSGHCPTLIERNTGPTHKVCGDFLSADTIRQLRALGCDPAHLGAAPVDRVRLLHGKRQAEATLPFPALSLSRRALDQALLDRAQQEGATLLAGQTVRRLTRDGAGWIVHADTPHAADSVSSPPASTICVIIHARGPARTPSA